MFNGVSTANNEVTNQYRGRQSENIDRQSLMEKGPQKELLRASQSKVYWTAEAKPPYAEKYLNVKAISFNFKIYSKLAITDIPNLGIPQGRIYLRGNWDHKLADSNCRNIDPLEDIAEIILTIV